MNDGYDYYCQSLVAKFVASNAALENLDALCGCVDYVAANPALLSAIGPKAERHPRFKMAA